MPTNTTATSQTHNGNGSTATFAISFSFLENSEVDVTVGGVLKTLGTHYNISGSSVTFTSGNIPPSGTANIKFTRDTNISTKRVDFEDGSVLTETDLDTNTDQILFAQQEITDKLNGIEEGATADQTNAEIRAAVEAASDSNVFTDEDHTKLNNIEDNATADQTVTEIKSLIAGSPLDASHLAANSVDSSELVDGSVDTSHLSADCVTTDKIADNAVTSAKIANGTIQATDLATNAVATDRLQDGAVTTVKIADSNVTTGKIATDAVTNAKIADGAVDTAQLNDTAVTQAKIQDAAITEAKIASQQVTGSRIANLAVGTPQINNSAVTTDKLANGAVTNAKLADAELQTLAGMQSGTASKLADSTALTSDIADLNQLDGMQKATTITDDDTKFPTSGAIVDYVAAQLAPIGGLEAIANENSFPNTQPQSGVVISIADAGGLAVSSTGTASGQTVGGTTVNISGIATNFRGSSISAGVRLLVVSTGAGQNYTYHKATLKEDDLVALSGDINDFGERYRVGSSFPTTNNDSGDLFWHTGLGKLYVYNGTTSAFEETQSIGNFFISTLSPAFDGSTQNFTITNAPTNAQQILLIIEGVLQKPNSGTSTPTEGFALDGSTVKLAAAPAVGASYHAVVMGSAVNIGTPSDNTVTTAILQNNSVSSAKIQDDAVTTAKIASGAVNTSELADGGITSAKLATNSVTTAKISDGNVTTAKLANDAVTGAKIADDAINSEHIAAGALDSEHIASGTGFQVGSNNIENNAVVTSKIQDGAVTGAKIGNGEIDADSKLVNNSILAGKIANNAIETAKIQNSAVTNDKIASGISSSKLTGALPAIDGSALTGLSGGITMAQNWRLTSSSQGNQTPLTNWEAIDTYGEGNVGSSMSVSNGVFTYPTTGRYLVIFFLVGYSDSSSQNVMGYIEHTTNNSNFNNVANGLNGIYDFSNSYPSWANTATMYMFNISATGQQKTRFIYGAGQGNEYVLGSSSTSHTTVSFIRLAD